MPLPSNHLGPFTEDQSPVRRGPVSAPRVCPLGTHPCPHCSSTVSLEITGGVLQLFCLQVVLATLDPLHVHVHNGTSLSLSTTERPVKVSAGTVRNVGSFVPDTLAALGVLTHEREVLLARVFRSSLTPPILCSFQ